MVNPSSQRACFFFETVVGPLVDGGPVYTQLFFPANIKQRRRVKIGNFTVGDQPGQDPRK